MMSVGRRISLVVALSLGVAGCPGPEEPPPAENDRPVAPAPEPDVELPDTTGESVWSYLQEANYQRWQVWPNTMPFYEGTEPHGALLTTYLNDRALGALTGGDGPLPGGSLIVKESYDGDSTMVDITVMYVADGYNPRHDDFFWAKYDPDGRVDMAGRLDMCQACHRAAARSYLMTLQALLPPEPDED
jgi:hypothetical protein